MYDTQERKNRRFCYIYTHIKGGFINIYFFNSIPTSASCATVSRLGFDSCIVTLITPERRTLQRSGMISRRLSYLHWLKNSNGKYESHLNFCHLGWGESTAPTIPVKDQVWPKRPNFKLNTDFWTYISRL